jgi:hypothetical protein
MSVHQRAQDILIGAIFGLVLGIIGNLWTDVFDHLVFENYSKDILWCLLFIYTIGLGAFGIGLWSYMKRLGRHNP